MEEMSIVLPQYLASVIHRSKFKPRGCGGTLLKTSASKDGFQSSHVTLVNKSIYDFDSLIGWMTVGVKKICFIWQDVIGSVGLMPNCLGIVGISVCTKAMTEPYKAKSRFVPLSSVYVSSAHFRIDQRKACNMLLGLEWIDVTRFGNSPYFRVRK